MKQGPDLPLRDDQWEDGKLVVQDDIEEGTVNLQSAILVKESQFAELIHEETDAGPRGADHLSQRFLTDLRVRLPGF